MRMSLKYHSYVIGIYHMDGDINIQYDWNLIRMCHLQFHQNLNIIGMQWDVQWKMTEYDDDMMRISWR